MQITIDSNESLADVLRVISSVYDVTLTTAEERPVTSSDQGPSLRSTPRRTSKKNGRQASGGKGSAGGDKADPKLVRQWAWENGLEVNARGSLPTTVRDAYRAANPA